MALIRPKATDETRRLFDAGLREFLLDVTRGDLVSEPVGFRVFTMGLEEILAGASLNAAESAGWRFLARDSRDQSFAGEVWEDPHGQNPHMASLASDPVFGVALRMIDELGTLPAAVDRNLEVRLVRIPGALVEAFWLHSDVQGYDLVVPILSAAPELQIMHPYSTEDFLKIVRHLSEGFLEGGGAIV